jgi:hypothetical protein
MDLVYNAIIRRHILYKINEVISSKYLAMKFHTNKGVVTVRWNQMISKKCTITCLKGENALLVK